MPLHVEIVPATPDPAAFRQVEGIQAACGDYLALIDDGTIVTDGWLDQLLGLADSILKAGLIASMLPDAAPPQRRVLPRRRPHALRRLRAARRIPRRCARHRFARRANWLD